MFQKQLTFNSTLVDHINRNAAAHRETRQAIDGALAVLRAEIAYLSVLHSHLILYLQQITVYVDTKDRETAGRALIVNAAVNALAEDLAKRWESMTAREQRFDAKVSALTAAHEELRTLVGIVQQSTLTIKREMERSRASAGTNEDASAAFRPRVAQGGNPAESIPRLPRRSMPTSTSGSRTSSADRRTRSASGSPATCRISKARATCWTWAAGAASFSISCTRTASRRAASI